MHAPAALPGLLVAGLLAGRALLVPGPASPLAAALVAGALLADVRPAAGGGEHGSAAALAAAGVVPDLVLELAAPTRSVLLAVGMVGLGSAVQSSRLRRPGLRPLVLGLLSWILLAGGTLLGVLAITSGHDGP